MIELPKGVAHLGAAGRQDRELLKPRETDRQISRTGSEADVMAVDASDG